MTTAITAANTEATIITATKTALVGAVYGAAVAWFKAVVVSTSEEQARDCQYKGDAPRIVVLVGAPEEAKGVAGEVACTLPLTLLIAAKADRGVDESSAVTALLELANVAKNAIETTIPASAKGFADDTNYHNPVEWGAFVFTTEEDRLPWVTGELPLEFGFTLSSPTSH